tara:strand:- start:1581 stop:2303 length:723 start_codon:yes stop_codon:yes gene_type:complete
MFNIFKKLKNRNKESFGDTDWEEREIDMNSLILSWFYNLPKNSQVLEAGCGAGNYVIALTNIGHNVFGLEIDEKRIKIAQDYMEKYNLNPKKIIQGDLQKLPFKDNQFDAIFCHGVIEHIKHSEEAVKEMTRVLKNKGFAMISVPNKYTFFTISKILLQSLDKIFKTNLWNVGYEKSFSQWQFKRILSNHLKIIDFEKKQIVPGNTFPLYGKILKILDKPLWILGIGGGWMYSWCQKNEN